MRGFVVHIVPHLPPPPEGVGSFAAALADSLSARHGLENKFIVAPGSDAREPKPGEHSALRIPYATSTALCDAILEAAGRANAGVTVLLHYANYGYQPRGCPTWLIDGLSKWKDESQGRLVTFFHEVHAMGPPWRSSFWLSPAQRRLAATLARLSDGLATSMRLYQRILVPWVPGKDVAVLPVFSTVGEPRETPRLVGRVRRMVVFGGPGARARAYRELKQEIEAICRDLQLEELCDVGPGDGLDGHTFSVRGRRLGILPENEVSALLRSSVAGFVAYPPAFLPKSTIFAAYCAHRMLPVCSWRSLRRELEPPPPFWTPKPAGTTTCWEELQEIADRAHAWYGGHSLDQHTAAYMRLLFPNPS